MPALDSDAPEADLQRAAELLRSAARADEPAADLSEARDVLGWSQVDMGEALDLSVQKNQYRCPTLSAWERGARRPEFQGRKKLRKLADELDEAADS